MTATARPIGVFVDRYPVLSETFVVNEIEALATSTDLSIRAIQKKIAGRASRGIVGEITKRARGIQPQAL